MNDDLLPGLLDAVEQQLASPQTPYVAKCLDRLVKLGISQSEAKEQIVICLLEEMERILRTGTPFDEKAYQMALSELPRLGD